MTIRRKTFVTQRDRIGYDEREACCGERGSFDQQLRHHSGRVLSTRAPLNLSAALVPMHIVTNRICLATLSVRRDEPITIVFVSLADAWRRIILANG